MIRIALIGCGGIAFHAHGPALSCLQREGMAELAACCDTDAVRAEAFRQTFGFARAYCSHEEMLKTENPNVAFALLPVRLNAVCAIHTLELGCPVAMEKPPGTDMREAMAIEQAAHRHKLYHAVLFNRRSMPLVQLLKHQLMNEKIEAVSFEMCRRGRSNEDFTTTAVHGIDCLRYLFGNFEELIFDYQQEADRGNTNYFAHGSFTNGARVDMRFLPCTGAVTERIAVYAAGKHYYLHLPVWSGTTYEQGLDFPGSLVKVENEQVAFHMAGNDLSRSEDGFVLNGFFDEDKRVLEAIEAGDGTGFPVSDFLQSVEISNKLRNRQLNYKQGEHNI